MTKMRVAIVFFLILSIAPNKKCPGVVELRFSGLPEEFAYEIRIIAK